MLPLSNTTTALDATSIGMTSAILLGGGADINMGSSSYIPIQVEYGMLPSSEDVKTSIIRVKAGFGYRF